jgi:3-oxoacyl-[acyl-carrier-protein] synthase-3
LADPPAPGSPGWRAVITGTGCCLPAGVLTNADVACRVDVDDAWIVERTGIRERRAVTPGASAPAATLALAAARRALESAALEADALDLVLVATVTPDRLLPGVAPAVAAGLGARCGALDLSAACAGFVHGLALAQGQIQSGLARHVLLVGVEVLTPLLDLTDRETCVLFGDGAGAVVLSAFPASAGRGLQRVVLESEGAGGDLLYADAVERRIRMEGREVFRRAVTHLGAVITRTLEADGWSPEMVDHVVPHQANLRILDALSRKVGIPRSRVHANLERYGNTSAASIPIVLDELHRSGRLQPGERVLFAALGAGLVWGAATHVW